MFVFHTAYKTEAGGAGGARPSTFARGSVWREERGGNFLEKQGMEVKEKRGRPGGKEGEKMQSTASEIDQRRNELLLSPTTQCNCMQAFAPRSPFLNSQ